MAKKKTKKKAARLGSPRPRDRELDVARFPAGTGAIVQRILELERRVEELERFAGKRP